VEAAALEQGVDAPVAVGGWINMEKRADGFDQIRPARGP